MDVSRPPAGNSAMKLPVPTSNFINLVSDDDEEDSPNGYEAHNNVSADTHEEDASSMSANGHEEDDSDDNESGEWDVDSLYEDAMQEITDQELNHGGKATTYP